MSLIAIRRPAVLGLTLLLAVMAVPPHTQAADRPQVPYLENVLRDYDRAWDESINEGRERYERLSEKAVNELESSLPGIWYVVRFDPEGKAYWVRGVLERVEATLDPEGALREARRLRGALGKVMSWEEKEFGEVVVREDTWTHIVEFLQLHRGTAIAGAHLSFRFFKEYGPDDHAAEQWNLELIDYSRKPPGETFTAEVSPEDALNILRESGLMEGEPKGDPFLVYASAPGEEDLRLCWEVECRSSVFRVDAVSGRLVKTVEKTFYLK
jgi:hypothetical protein